MQEVVEKALTSLLRERVSVVASGRTDAGVHAAGQVVSFRTSRRLPVDAFVHGANSALPDDVAILSAEEMPSTFHAQKNARGKLYRYRILNRRVRSPLARRFTHPVGRPLDEGRMAEAAAHLTGTRDFSSFRNAGSMAGSAVRTLRRLDVERSGEYIDVEAEGDGFLYKMVRNLVGTLIKVGDGGFAPGDIPGILERRDRGVAGPTAPACGLCLVEVYY